MNKRDFRALVYMQARGTRQRQNRNAASDARSALGLGIVSFVIFCMWFVLAHHGG